jgi:tetratricopeptide (TPR) repeat protein
MPAWPPSPAVATHDPFEEQDQVAAMITAGRRALEEGEFRLADQLLRRALVLSPSNPETLGALGEARFELARYQEALLYAQRAARLAPRTARYHILVGDASLRLGLEADAAASYARAEVLQPDDATVRARMDRLQQILPRRRTGAQPPPARRAIEVNDPYAGDRL